MDLKSCNVGPFLLPGISIDKSELTPEIIEEMKEWSINNDCGKALNDGLWMFKSELARDWFILRWS